jgi:CheY-like chemotaxis protein/GGDEF domain-containing protein
VLASRETSELKDLETALYSAGYRVLTARTEHDTLAKVHAHTPDAIFLDRDMTEAGYDLCRAVRADPGISAAAPIMLTQDEAPTRTERLESLRAGAWDVQGYPPDSEELLLRLGVFLNAKLELDRLTVECLIDRGSGLYNSHGFAQRADELAALTSRQGVAAACAVFQPSEDLPSRASGDRLGRAFKTVGRLSDAIGRTAHSEFVVFAPGTNDWAAARLVRRMRDNVIREVGPIAEQGRPLMIRAAYSASQPTQKVEPRALLERARASLQFA